MMTEIIRKTLRDSKTARWTALLIVSFTMFAGYFLSDAMSPLQGMLEKDLGWNSADYGWYTGAYGWFNVFLFFLILGGLILDKMGIRFTGITSAAIMVVGVAIKYWAITTHSLDGMSWTILFWNFKAQVWMAAFGYTVFGVGVEVAGITVSKIIVKWFQGHELALAMGLQVAIARLGTALALMTSLPIAKHFGTVSVPILIALIMLCIGLLAFFVYAVSDKKLDKSLGEYKAVGPEEEFHVRDLLFIIKNKGFWYVTMLCALFYSAVFPFLKYATNFMINKFDVAEDWAGSIPGLLPFGTIILTPFFGSLYDRKGKGATIMIIGAFIITSVHLLFAIPFLNHWIIAILLMIVLGFGFSLVPSAMWPSIPKIIPERQLGTAFALMFWLQNAIALMFVPALIGWVLHKYCVTSSIVINGHTQTTYNYTLPMLIFTTLGLLSIVMAFMLKAEDKKKGYGLQLPNIKK